MSRSSLFGSDDELDEDGEDNITFHAAKEAPNDASQSSNSNATTVPEWGFNTQVAKLTPPDIAGFYLFRDLVSLETQESLLHRILEEKAVTAKHPQAMLFPRSSQSGKDIQDCPSFLSDFVEILPQLLRPHLPLEDLNAVFEESLPLQTIINLYEPGQGITPHVRARHLDVDHD